MTSGGTTTGSSLRWIVVGVSVVGVVARVENKNKERNHSKTIVVDIFIEKVE